MLQTVIFTFLLGICNLKLVALFTNSMNKCITLKILAAFGAVVLKVGGIAPLGVKKNKGDDKGSETTRRGRKYLTTNQSLS